MSLKTDVVNLIVTVNGDAGKKEFVELKAKAAQISAELKTMKKGTAEFIEKSKELAIVQGKFKALRGEMDLNSLSIKDLRQEISKMKSIRNELDPASKEFTTLGERIHLAEGRMRELNQGGTFLSRTFEFLKREALGFGVVMLGALGIDYVIGKIGNLIQRQAELSDSFAKIRRTTGMSQQAVEDLNKSISKIDTRTAKKDLRDIAVVLGQVGEPANVESIAAIDKIVVALGDEFQGGADEITSALSVLRNNFTTFKSGDYAGDIEKIGNSLSVLGKTGLATAPVVTDMATRMSGVLGTFKVTAGQTLGLAAAMQEMGITVERGSTAVTKLVQKMAQNPEVFAKVAGAKTKKEIQDFIELLNTDAVSALLKVAEGSKAAGNSNVEFAGILKELESTGAGVSEVLAKFAANGEMVKEKVDLASASIQKTDTIQSSFAISNENVAAKIAKLQKQFAALWESQAVTNFLKGAIDGAFNFIQTLKNLAGFLERNWFLIKALIIAYATYYIAMGRLVTVKTIEIAIDKAGYALLSIRLKLEEAYALVKQVLTTRITAAAAAQQFFNSTLLANPIVLITTLVFGLTAAITGYIDSLRDAKFAADEAFSAKKLEADLKYRKETFKAENASILKDIQEGNKSQLKIDEAAVSTAIELRNEELRQLKGIAAEKIQLFEDVQKKTSGGVYANVDTRQNIMISEAELSARKKLAEDAQKNLDDAIATQDNYVELRKQVSQKLIELDNNEITSAKELTEKQKAELDKRKKAQQQYLADLKKYQKELQSFYDKVEQAKIDVIEEEMASGLASLDFKYKLELQKILAERNTLIGQSKNLKQSKEEQQKIEEQSVFLKLAAEKKYQEERQKLIEKYAEELKTGNYNNELKAINDFSATQKLLYTQLYADQLIDKNTYENQLQNADISAKQKLFDVAQRYGINVTKAAQDLADGELKIMADNIARKQALLKREADFKVALAEYNYNKAGGDTNENLQAVYESRILQLGNALQTELALVEGGEEEKFQIYQEYNLKRKQLEDEFAQSAQQQRQDEYVGKGNMVMQFAAIANDFAQQIFDFKKQKLDEEIQAAQNTYDKQSTSLNQQYINHLISDVDYNNKKKSNQDKLDKELRAMKRKQAIADKAAAIFSIAINTGQAIMSALAGPWPASIAFAALAGAMGAVQIGMAAAKPIPQFVSGGYTKKVVGEQTGKTYDAKILPGFGQGYLTNPSLVLAGEHGEEYFVNNTMLKNPTVKYVVDGIDQLTKGNISYADFQGMLAMPALQQKYTGGYVGTANTAAPIYNKADNTQSVYGDMLIKVATTINRLNEHLDVGIKADARIGDYTIVKLDERNEYLKSIVDEAN